MTNNKSQVGRWIRCFKSRKASLKVNVEEGLQSHAIQFVELLFELLSQIVPLLCIKKYLHSPDRLPSGSNISETKSNATTYIYTSFYRNSEDRPNLVIHTMNCLNIANIILMQQQLSAFMLLSLSKPRRWIEAFHSKQRCQSWWKKDFLSIHTTLHICLQY